MIDRIASFSQTKSILDGNLRIQKQYSETQIQISSGLKSPNYQGISKDTNQLLNLETELDSLKTQTENARLAQNRSEATFDSLGSILSTADTFLSDLQGAVSNSGITAAQLQSIATLNLNDTTNNLNTTLSGRHLHGGSDTANPPVDLSGYGGQLIPSSADTSYYVGNQDQLSVEAAEGFTVNYAIRADNPAIEKIMRAYDLVMTTPNDSATLNEAFSLLRSGIDETAELKATVAQNSQILSNRVAENEEDMVLVENMITDIKEIDIAEASIKLRQLESQLEASYSVTTRVLDLKLSDFLR